MKKLLLIFLLAILLASCNDSRINDYLDQYQLVIPTITPSSLLRSSIYTSPIASPTEIPKIIVIPTPYLETLPEVLIPELIEKTPIPTSTPRKDYPHPTPRVIGNN